MTNWTEEKLLKFFSKAFHEVVTPLLENIATKDDLEELRTDMATKNDIDRLERKIVKIDDRLDRCGGKIDSQERRITKVEKKLQISP